MEKLFQFPDQCIDVQRQLAPFEFETAAQKQKCIYIYMVDARDDVKWQGIRGFLRLVASGAVT